MKTVSKPAPYLPKIRLSLLNEAQALYQRLIDRINDDSIPTDDRLERLAEAAANRVNRRLAALTEHGAEVRLGWHFDRPEPPDILDTLDGAAVVLNSYLFSLSRRLRDFSRDLHNDPVEVREAIEGQRDFVRAEFDRAEHIRDRLSDLRYVIARQGECVWRYDDDGFWDTDCDSLWATLEGTPAENSMKYCPMCGGIIVLGTHEHGDEGDEDDDE